MKAQVLEQKQYEIICSSGKYESSWPNNTHSGFPKLPIMEVFIKKFIGYRTQNIIYENVCHIKFVGRAQVTVLQQSIENSDISFQCVSTFLAFELVKSNGRLKIHFQVLIERC